MRGAQIPLSSVLVKPAGPDCNMACSYCFYLKKSDLFSASKRHRMPVEMLEEMVKQVMKGSGREVSFGWQGGEPTLMGLQFFRKAVEFQQRYGCDQVVGNGLQTNGVLLDRKWAQFLKEYKFLVGLSLDGPEHVHDRYRRMPSGRGSWQIAVDRTKLLLDAGVEVNSLTVLNDYSVRHPDEIYEFHKSIGLTYMQFIPCLERNPADPQEPAPFSAPPYAYGQFLCRTFDLWLADFLENKPTTSVRYFDSVLFSYVGLIPPECTLLERCGVYVVIEHNGDFFSCDFFVEPEWRLGNMMKDNIADMLHAPRQRAFGALKAELPGGCRSCRWLKYCYGGCPKDRTFSHPGAGLNYFCPSYKMFFEHANGRLRALAEEWARSSQQQDAGDRIDIQRNAPCLCGSGKKYKKCCGRVA